MNFFKKALLYCIGIIAVLVGVFLLLSYRNACTRNIGVVTMCNAAAASGNYGGDSCTASKSDGPDATSLQLPLRLNECKRVGVGDVLLVHLNDGTHFVVGGPAQLQVTEFNWRRDRRDGEVHIKLTQGSLLAQLPPSCSDGGDSTYRHHFYLPCLYAVAQSGRVGFHASTRLGESMATVLRDSEQRIGKLKLPDKCRLLRFHLEVYRTNGRSTCRRPHIGSEDMDLWFHKQGSLVHRLDALVDKDRRNTERRSRKSSSQPPSRASSHNNSTQHQPSSILHPPQNRYRRRAEQHVTAPREFEVLPAAATILPDDADGERRQTQNNTKKQVVHQGKTSAASSSSCIEKNIKTSAIKQKTIATPALAKQQGSSKRTSPTPSASTIDSIVSRRTSSGNSSKQSPRHTLADGDQVILSCDYGYVSRIPPNTPWFSADGSRVSASSFTIECTSRFAGAATMHDTTTFQLRHSSTGQVLGVVTEGGVPAVSLGRGSPLTWRARRDLSDGTWTDGTDRSDDAVGGGTLTPSSLASIRKQQPPLQFMQPVHVQDTEFLLYLCVDPSGIMLSEKSNIAFHVELYAPLISQ